MPLPPEQVQRALAQLQAGRSDGLYGVGDLVVEAAAARIREQSAEGYQLRQELRQHRAATIERVFALAASWCRQLLGQIRMAAAEAGAGVTVDPAALSSATYLERLSHLTVERLLVHPAAPPLHLSPMADPRLAAGLASAPVVAVIFDYPLGIAHELYPLWTDAFVHRQGGDRSCAVVGVHVSWLDEACRARRIIAYDDVADRFLEADLPTPLSPAAALLLAQAPTTHRQISQRLQGAGLPHINVYSQAAEVADDKWTCYQRWSEAGVATPPTCLLPSGAASNQLAARIVDFMAACRPLPAGWFVQPRHGTESAGVDWLPPGDRAPGRALSAWQRIAAADDAILRPQVGLIWLEGPAGVRPFDLRLHVFRHGDCSRAGSGYLICAPGNGDLVSAMARGASVERLGLLTGPRLRWQGGGPSTSVPWAAVDLERAADMASRASAALNLDLAGVDVKLDLIDGLARPVILDANPRPAGLLHGDLLAADPPEPGIGEGLWRQLALLAGDRR